MNHIAQLYARWERLEAERKEVSDTIKDFFTECKSHGYDTKALKASFKIAATKDNPDVQEHNALVEMYVASISDASEQAPSHTHTREQAA